MINSCKKQLINKDQLKSKLQKTTQAVAWAALSIFGFIGLSACSSKIATVSDTKYIPEFQQTYFSKGVDEISPDKTIAYMVDYSKLLSR